MVLVIPATFCCLDILTLAQFHDGLRRVIVNALLMDVDQIPRECTALGSSCSSNSSNSNNSASNMNPSNSSGVQSLSLGEVFNNKLPFPNHIPYMNRYLEQPTSRNKPLRYPFEFECDRYETTTGKLNKRTGLG